MAKSIDRCVCGDCSNVCMKESDQCFACFNDTFVNLMSGDFESMPLMDECYGSGRSCEIDGCFNTPQDDETICGSCWNKHDSSDTPGFMTENEWIGEDDTMENDPLFNGELEGSVPVHELCAGCGKEECFCSFIDLVESDFAE